MTVHHYKGEHAFKGLFLEAEERIEDRKTFFKYMGFSTLGQAMEFCSWWEEVTGWAYDPSSYAIEENGVLTAYCERWNS